MKKITVIAFFISLFASAAFAEGHSNEVNIFSARHYDSDVQLYKIFTDKKSELEAINDAQSHEKLSNDFLNEKGSADFHIHIKEFIDEMEKKEAEKKNKRELKKAESEAKMKKKQIPENNLELFML